MSTATFRRTTISIVCLGCLSVATGTSYITNGSFDGATIAPWTVGTDVLATIDKNASDYHSGPSCISLQMTSPVSDDDDQPWRLTQEFSTLPSSSDTLELTFWARCADTTQATSFEKVVVQSAANLWQASPPTYSQTGWWQNYGGFVTSKWTQFSIRGITNSNDSTNDFQVFIIPSTTPILFDDFDIHQQVPLAAHTRVPEMSADAVRINSGSVSFVCATRYSFRLLTINGREVLHENGYGKSIDFLAKGIRPGYYLVKGTSDAGEFSGGVLIGGPAGGK